MLPLFFTLALIRKVKTNVNDGGPYHILLHLTQILNNV